jgi:hypothetical protein
MATEQERKDVEFKTFDGLTLRGSLYVGPKGGPAVIVNGAVSQPQTNTFQSAQKLFKILLT